MEGICVPSKFYSILASGRATIGIVAPNCEVAYVLDEAECGIRVDHCDVPGLVDAILTLERDSEYCAKLGQNARRVLESNYSARKVSDRYVRAFATIMNELSPVSESVGKNGRQSDPRPQQNGHYAKNPMRVQNTVVDSNGQTIELDSLSFELSRAVHEDNGATVAFVRQSDTDSEHLVHSSEHTLSRSVRSDA
jgi:hypothetical protein